MKRFLERRLRAQAKAILAKYKPTVVAVTGSVGKTSTRNAIAAVLGGRFRVRSPEQNYNNEFGVPLTIVGCTSPGRSVFGWLKVFAKAQRLLWTTDRSYPNLLVLEYGADAPGDIPRLCELAQPDVSVWTAVSPVHAANFPDKEALAEEKAHLVRCVKPLGLAVMNADDPTVMRLQSRAAAPVRTYGFAPTAHVRGENELVRAREDGSFEPGEPFVETLFDLVTDHGRASVVLPDLIGRAQASAALAAAAVGLHFGLTPEEIAERLRTLKPQSGRMRALPGIKGSLVLDDTYNAAPASVAAALTVLGHWPVVENARRIATLGTMAELGQYSEAEHRMAGMHASQVADIVIAVGEPARDLYRAAKEAGMDEGRVHWFGTSEEAGRWLDANVRQGDVVLVKGSQSARMEKAVKDIMAEPLRAPELLCRQFGKWLKE